MARGQARIVLDSRPIPELLADSRLDSTVRRQLKLVGAIRAFAADSLGLEQGSNYTRYYDTGGDPVSWNISASPADRFAPYTWDFPLVGALPYKGYFERPRAEAARDRLQKAGYDVLLRPVSAYSTLGFFSDPVLSTMMSYTPVQLADLIIHELTHSTIFADGQADFNESLAGFIGRAGSLWFVRHHFGDDTPLVPQALQSRQDRRLFRRFMVKVVARLDSLYGQGLPLEQVLARRQAVFAAAKDEYRALRPQFQRLNYDGFLQWEVNNARLLSYRRYHREPEVFQRVVDISGGRLDKALKVFKGCEDADDPWACLKAWHPD